jgi:hypothetical protein
MIKVLEIFLWHLCCGLTEGTLEPKKLPQYKLPVSKFMQPHDLKKIKGQGPSGYRHVKVEKNRKQGY